MVAFERVSKHKIGQILISKGLITKEQLRESLGVKHQDGKSLTGDILVKLGYVTEQEIIEAVLTQYNIPYLAPDNYKINKKALELIPEELVLEGRFIPIDIMDNFILVIMADPFDKKTIAEIEEISKYKTKVFIATPSQIKKAIEKYYPKKHNHEDRKLESTK